MGFFVMIYFFFFFNDTATTEIYTLSLHDALPIPRARSRSPPRVSFVYTIRSSSSFGSGVPRDRKSTRLNSSHMSISYAVFCLKKKKTRHSQFSFSKKKKKKPTK